MEVFRVWSKVKVEKSHTFSHVGINQYILELDCCFLNSLLSLFYEQHTGETGKGYLDWIGEKLTQNKISK